MTTASQAIQKVRYTHDAMIDLILLKPGISQGELAREFGYTETWVSIIMNSDAFKVALAARRKEVADPILVATLEERLRGLVDISTRVVSDHLTMRPDPKIALKALEVGAKALGFGAREDKPTGPAYVVVVPPREPTTQAWMNRYNPLPPIDVTPEPVGG